MLNKKLSHARYRVECAFGQMKCRWRILLKNIIQHIGVAPDMVYALCIIQNVMLDHNNTFACTEEERRHIVEDSAA